MLFNFLCRAKQVFRRRLLWPLLLLAGLVAYPVQLRLQDNAAANEAAAQAAMQTLDKPGGASRQDVLEAAAHAAAIVRAKVVDPDQLYSKMSIAVGVFVLKMFLIWSALQAVMPVLPDWAVGRYRQKEHWEAAELAGPVRGFKGAFLGPDVSPLARLVLFLAAFALLAYVASDSVTAAFTIQ